MQRLILLLLCLFTANVFAVEKVAVVALFPGKAMLMVDGKRKVLSTGEFFKGVRLTAVDVHAATAILKFNGKTETLGLSRAINASYKKPSHTKVRILQDSTGSYRVNGSINGKSTNFLVDTGANVMAISEATATKLSIPFAQKEFNATVQTASGSTKARIVRLKQVKVGGIEISNLDCVVIPGSNPPQPLLGMNFLRQLEISHQGNLMILTRKY